MNPHDSHMYFTEGKASDGRLVVVRGVCHGTEKTAFEGVTFGGWAWFWVGFWGRMVCLLPVLRPSRCGVEVALGETLVGRGFGPKVVGGVGRVGGYAGGGLA